jgi:ectoine hydroxylase-related dioxygenase (phytanoyl-CoA dioxygenase family)
MPEGSVLVFTGTTWHGAGANATPRTCEALTTNYSLGWLRQGENQYLSVPAEVARLMPVELLTLIG